MPLVLTFPDVIPNVNEILEKKRHQTLVNSNYLNIFSPNIPIVAYRRDTNLKDIIIHKKHNKIFLTNRINVKYVVKTVLLFTYQYKFSDSEGNV